MFTGQLVSNFRERFNDLFTESHKTNTDLGKELNVSNQTISAWRLGTRSPKAPTVAAIASYFKVNVRWLMGFDVEKEEPQQQTRKIPVINSDFFVRLTEYMTTEEYETVAAIFERAGKRMREAEEAQNGEVQA